MTTSKYMEFRLLERKPKTSVYGVFSKNRGDRLGEIRWHSPWRQYVFLPSGDTVFSGEGRQALIEEVVKDKLKQYGYYC